MISSNSDEEDAKQVFRVGGAAGEFWKLKVLASHRRLLQAYILPCNTEFAHSPYRDSLLTTTLHSKYCCLQGGNDPRVNQ